MANIDHAAALKAAKKRVWYLENRERVLAKAKQKRDAAKTTTETVQVTKVNGQYTLQLNGVKLVLSADNQVTIEQATSKVSTSMPTVSSTVELRSNGQPYKTSAAKRRAMAKYQAKNGEYRREYYQANKEKINERTRAYSKTDAGKAASRRYYEANRDKILEKARIRNANKLSKLPVINTATLIPFGTNDVSDFSMIRNITK